MSIIEQMRKSGFESLTDDDLLKLLTVEGETQQELFAWARDVRRENDCDDVLLRGVIEISNVCNKNCDYCAMRSSNKDLDRYSMTAEEILGIARLIKESGIQIVFLQGGQNPRNDTLLEQVIPVIRNEMKMGVLLCLGERSQEVYEKFVKLGAVSYILKFETSESELYKEITGSSLENRLKALKWAQSAGLKVGTGNIVGLAKQTLRSLVNDIRLGISIRPDFISSSPFIPNAHTPMEHQVHGNVNMTLNTLAILRIALKTAAIPSVSALESLVKDGQRMGLDAGANVLTVNFTPKDTQSLYKIYSERRFVVSLDHALKTIDKAGLQVRKTA